MTSSALLLALLLAACCVSRGYLNKPTRFVRVSPKLAMIAETEVFSETSSMLLSADTSAFATPLIVSFLTLIPFLIYQNALKPKPRTVKQIELDESLRPIDKKLSSGKAGSAKAGKKK